MPEPVVVRRASAAEVVPLRMLVLRPGRPRADAIWEGDDEADTRHWVAERQGRVVGTASVLRRPYPDGAGPSWQLRGMAVLPAEQGAGVGREVLDALVREVGERLWCNARVSALSFYRRAGWAETSETFDTGVGPHRRMVSQR